MNSGLKKICDACNLCFNYENDDAKWDYSCIGYNLKIVKCPICGKINIIKEEKVILEQEEFDNFYQGTR